MVKTGKDFDMNPETFTLANLFAMDLHKFIDTIGDIVTAAAKELSIERVPNWCPCMERISFKCTSYIEDLRLEMMLGKEAE